MNTGHGTSTLPGVATTPALQLIAGGGDEEAPAQEAWCLVAEGLRAAARVTGLSPAARARFRRMLRAAERLANRKSVELIR